MVSNQHTGKPSTSCWFSQKFGCLVWLLFLILKGYQYSNSPFKRLSKSELRKLQCIQNRATCIVKSTSRYNSITPALKKLHWLPVKHRLVFITVTLVYKFLKTGFPRYFSPFLHLQRSWCNTSCSQNVGSLLVVPNFYHQFTSQIANLATA